MKSLIRLQKRQLSRGKMNKERAGLLFLILYFWGMEILFILRQFSRMGLFRSQSRYRLESKEPAKNAPNGLRRHLILFRRILNGIGTGCLISNIREDPRNHRVMLICYPPPVCK